MDLHITVILFAGAACLLIFILPSMLKGKIVTPAMIYVAVGFALFSLPVKLPLMDPENDYLDRQVLEYLTEFIVILSLASIGLKIDRKLTWKNWSVTGRLLGITMPLTIALLAAAAYFVLGLAPAACILLGAVLAPTDPVLADNIQVDPPNSGDGHPVKFALTTEAGLNDALAFPFVFLAIMLEQDGFTIEGLLSWFSYYFLLKVTVGVVAGFLFGKLLAHFFFLYINKRDGKSEYSQGTFLIAATLITYGLTELLHGYGFLAVFVAALIGRQANNNHPAHRETYKSVTQVENLLIGIFLIAFGGVLATGGLQGCTWLHIAIALMLIFIIRPLAGALGLIFHRKTIKEKGLVSFFGIRGIGTIYYLAYAANEVTNFRGMDDLWLVANVSIVISIVVHGVADALLLSQLEEN